MFGGDCYPVELTWQQLPVIAVMSCPTRVPTVPRSNSPWTPHQRFVNMRPAVYRQACCSTMLHCLLPLLLPFQYITGCVCFHMPRVELKIVLELHLKSKPRILESFSRCDHVWPNHIRSFHGFTAQNFTQQLDGFEDCLGQGPSLEDNHDLEAMERHP